MRKMSKAGLGAIVSTLALVACATESVAQDADATAPAAAEEINRIAIPNSDFPISMGVVIPPGAEIYYVSGIVPQAIDAEADPNSREAYGDTKAQTETVLKEMQARMEDAGWSLGDIVMMRVYLVGDEATGGRLDFGGFMQGYSQFFGTQEQPNKPARAVVEVAGLIRPGWRVEIEAQAARIPD
nr:RidA family protein [Henriciella litoralis]